MNPNGKYDEIMGLAHHVSKTRPQMPMADRAAQFAPYAVYLQGGLTYGHGRIALCRALEAMQKKGTL